MWKKNNIISDRFFCFVCRFVSIYSRWNYNSIVLPENVFKLTEIGLELQTNRNWLKNSFHNEWLMLRYLLFHRIVQFCWFFFFCHGIFVADFTRDDVSELKDVKDAMMTSMRAKTIFLGTYRFDSQKELLFTSRGLRLTAPNMKRPSELVVLNIHRPEVVRMVYNFSPECCVIFMYVVSSCSKYVRDEIEMGSECKSKWNVTTFWPGRLATFKIY